MTVFALPFGAIARSAWGMVGGPSTPANHAAEVALARVREVEKERDEWIATCEELDEENELLKNTLTDLNRRFMVAKTGVSRTAEPEVPDRAAAD